MKTLVIIPCYNEEENILTVVRRLQETCPWADYLVVNDCSTDRSREILQSGGCRYLDLPVNLGIGGAVQSGYRYAEEHGYDVTVQMDGDGQHDLESLPQLLAPVEKGECDFCVGSRFLEGTSQFQSTRLRRLGIRYLSFLIRLLSGTKVTDPTSGFRAANKKVIAALADYYPTDYPEPESIVQIAKQRFRVSEVQVNMFQREGGVSSIHSWKSVYYMIKVSVAILCASLQRGKKPC